MERKKVISLVLIISIIMQSIVYLINPLRVYSSNEEVIESVIDTTLGTVTLKTISKKLIVGEIIPVEIYVGGNDIRTFGGYLNYDKEIFKKIDLNNDTEILDEWEIQDIGDSELGTEILIYANKNQYACTNEKIATLYFTVLKEADGITDITIKYVNLVNTDFEDNMDENYDFPNITLSIESNIEKHSITYNENTTEVVNNMPEAGVKKETADYTISNKIPEREGYKFLVWNTKQDGTGTNYNANDIYNVNEDLTLYAQWKQEEQEKPNEPNEPNEPDEPIEPIEPIEPNEKLYLSTENYKIGNNNIKDYEDGDKYISRVEKETTKEQFIANLETNGTIRIIKQDGTELGNNELVGTGMTIEVTKDEGKIELQIAVMGDLDGNGLITATDLSTLNQTILKIVTLENEYVIAGDLDENQNITATDLSTLNKMLLGNV